MHTNLETIYSILSDWLGNGQEFTTGAKEYAETVLGVCTLSELEPLLADSDNPDLEPFVEYLIFPDEKLLHALEPLLTSPLSNSDIKKLTSHLEAEAPCITLHDATAVCSVVVPEWLWEDFVVRLHLNDTTVAFLLQALPQGVKPLSLATRSYLRTANIPDKPFLHSALLQFFMTTQPHDPLFNMMLSTWIETITSLPTNHEKNTNTLEQQLEKRRRRLYKAIFDAQEFTLKLQRFNMETLMMSGDLPPAINVDEARIQIRIIDRIAIALFQKNVAAIEELEDRAWGDYVDYRQDLMLLPVFNEI